MGKGLRDQHVPFELQFNRWSHCPDFGRQKSHLLTLSSDFYRGHYGVQGPAEALTEALLVWDRSLDENLGGLLTDDFLAS